MCWFLFLLKKQERLNFSCSIELVQILFNKLVVPKVERWVGGEDKDLIYKEQKALHFLKGEAVFLSLYRKTTSIDKSTHLFLLGACSILKFISASHLSYLHTSLGSAHLRLRWPTELVHRECWPESSGFIVQISKQKNVMVQAYLWTASLVQYSPCCVGSVPYSGCWGSGQSTGFQRWHL